MVWLNWNKTIFISLEWLHTAEKLSYQTYGCLCSAVNEQSVCCLSQTQLCVIKLKRETVLPQVGPSDLQTLVLFCGWHSFNNTVKNHAGMLWSLQHVRLMGTNGKNRFTTTMLVTFLPWKGALNFFFKRTNRIMGKWVKDDGSKPQRQTCIRHLTRSRGTTAVCVVPQLRIPPKPHRMKYFCEPNSQLSPSEETQDRL